VLNSTFSGLQFCRRRRHYASIFIRVAVVASRNREITRNSDKIWPYSSPRSSTLVWIESPHATSYSSLVFTFVHQPWTTLLMWTRSCLRSQKRVFMPC